MNRSYANKKAFVIATMVILLCLVSLVGATFALFTGDSGKIGIVTTAGNVKVNIIDTSEVPQSLVGKVLNFQTSAPNQKIYFEPGASYYTQGFRIKNEGNITINYKLSLNTDSIEDKEKFDSGFELYVSTSPTGENPQNLDDFLGELDAQEISQTYFLVVKMRSDAGNDFQNKAYSGIGITVLAVQSNGALS